MNKREHIDFLNSILDGRNQFFEELSEGIFNRILFHNYTKTILELSKLHLDGNERCECIIMIWQINHRIQNSLILIVEIFIQLIILKMTTGDNWEISYITVL